MSTHRLQTAVGLCLVVSTSFSLFIIADYNRHQTYTQIPYAHTLRPATLLLLLLSRRPPRSFSYCGRPQPASGCSSSVASLSVGWRACRASTPSSTSSSRSAAACQKMKTIVKPSKSNQSAVAHHQRRRRLTGSELQRFEMVGRIFRSHTTFFISSKLGSEGTS